MKLAKYVKFREEKFGGVLFETRSEKVYTLNPTAVAVVREIQAGAAETEIAGRVTATFEGNGVAIEREVGEFLADLRGKGLVEEYTPVPAVADPAIAPAQAEPESQHLSAPLYVAWQITNECNLACMHCIEESGPGKKFKDELTETEVFAVLEQMMRLDIPYLSFSGGEPMLHPQFFEMAEYVCSRGSQLKVETNGHLLTDESCARLREVGVKAVQVSLDGASRPTFNRIRVLGEFDRTVDGIRRLHDAGVPINFSPTRFNIHEIAAAVDLAHQLGAYSFYTGRTMYTGNAVKAWRHLEVADADYETFFDTLRAKEVEYRGRMRVYFHEAGLLEELRYRLTEPAALIIVLPNGLVKLVNALPFICGDLRQDSLASVWANFQRAWRDPRVATFVDELARDPGRTRTLHQWVHL